MSQNPASQSPSPANTQTAETIGTTAHDDTPFHPDTVAIRSGRSANGSSLAPVLWATSTFVTPTVDEGRRMATTTGATEFYSRYGNPTVRAFEEAIAELEGAESARAFSSGMGAVCATVLGLCSSGDHIVTQKQLYAGTQMIFQGMCPRFGIDVTFVDGTDPDAWAAAVRPGKTVLLFGETPANPRLDIVDLAALAAVRGPMKVIDSTFATPLGQRPIDFGIDLVIHSATKAIAGHNDASLGVIAGSKELLDWIWGFAVLQGAYASPTVALAGIRGVRTLPIRLRQQGASAAAIASMLEKRSDISSVMCVASPNHPQAELIAAQMHTPSGLLTIELSGGLEAGRRFVESTRICQLATSLGGPETLVTHPASTTHVNLLPDELAAAGITAGTVRVSVGLEHTDDLLADISRALDLSAG